MKYLSLNRKCPSCGKDIVFSGTPEKVRYNLRRSENNNSKCSSCSKIGHKISENGRNSLKKHNIGKHCSDETKQKLSIFNKGKKLSDQTIQKLKEYHSKVENPAKRIEIRQKLSQVAKGRKHSDDTKRKISIKSKEMMMKYIEKLGIKVKPNFNIKSIEYLDKLNEERGWNLQHAKNGGEIRILCYYPDGYDKERNIIVEYDERRHYDIYGQLKKKDIIRMNEIIGRLHCKFYRYNEKRGELKEYEALYEIKTEKSNS
jgi:hypothetical protein